MKRRKKTVYTLQTIRPETKHQEWSVSVGRDTTEVPAVDETSICRPNQQRLRRAVHPCHLRFSPDTGMLLSLLHSVWQSLRYKASEDTSVLSLVIFQEVKIQHWPLSVALRRGSPLERCLKGRYWWLQAGWQHTEQSPSWQSLVYLAPSHWDHSPTTFIYLVFTRPPHPWVIFWFL